ncbi:hypothetical protein F5Y08DRAFT_315576 [Xylaria arbuscula]|nr:hypothetical protein F5Y08DRAFT_315576 [Xylaria arbuscula]
MADQEETPVPLPSAPLIQLAGGATLQPPLTRRGYGPGLIIITPRDPPLSPSDESKPEDDEQESSSSGESDSSRKAKTLDPLPLKKWAEEGYAVVQLVPGHGEQGWDIATALRRAIEALEKLETCNVKDRFGLIVYGEPKDYTVDMTSPLKAAYEAESRLVSSVSFSTTWDLSAKPELIHLPGAAPPPPPTSPSPPSSPSHLNTNTRKHYYTSTSSPSFILPSSPSFHYPSASVSHTRSLSFLRSALGGPVFDLETIWDEHTAYEFAARSVEKTMGTMIDEPYVNHVPTVTGGIGRRALTQFYRERFIHSNPADAGLELVSRTVGVDRVVDEFVFAVTHDRVIDWLLPGVPPTHKPLRIPFVAVVNIRGDRLYHEHIHWDQGTALRQAGLLPSYLPFPYALPDGRTPSGPGKKFEYRVPVGGVETAAKLADAGATASNAMFEYEVREVV